MSASERLDHEYAPKVIAHLTRERDQLRERVAVLESALRSCAEALKDHPQYDDPEDEPSLEALAYNEARAALDAGKGGAK